MSIDLKNCPVHHELHTAKPLPLGKNRDTPPKDPPKHAVIVRVSTAARLMAGHYNLTGQNIKGSSVQGCQRWRAYGADPNIAEIEVGVGRPFFKGHFLCKGCWACDYCSRKRVAQTRSWIRACLIPAMESKSLGGALMTFTLEHHYGDDWSNTLDKLTKAYTLFDRRMAKVYKKLGSVGKFKALEAPIGRNGIHGHFHVLLSHALAADFTGVEEKMSEAWLKAVKEVGGFASEKHGFDLSLNRLNDYAAKIETAHELASNGTKKARKKGKLLPELLDLASIGDKKASAEWVRAQEALGGRVRFHAGSLPKNLNIPTPSEWEDEPEVEEVEEPVDPLLFSEPKEKVEPMVIAYPQVLHLKATSIKSKRPSLAIILKAARTRDPEKVHQVVASLCAEVDRKEISQGDIQKFADWSDDYFEKLISEASVRPLEPAEVEAYIFGKSRLVPVD